MPENLLELIMECLTNRIIPEPGKFIQVMCPECCHWQRTLALVESYGKPYCCGLCGTPCMKREFTASTWPRPPKVDEFYAYKWRLERDPVQMAVEEIRRENGLEMS